MTRNALRATSHNLKRTFDGVWAMRLILAAISTFLLLSAGAITAESNPYRGIVDRNVFSLKEIPPPPPPPNPDANKPPPPPVTLNGITTLFGHKRAYLSVNLPGGKPGEPAKNTSLTLSEGQMDSEVEVIRIDEKAGSVLVRNHGAETNLTFDANGAKATGGGGTPGTGAVAVGTPTHTPGQSLFSPGGNTRSIPMRRDVRLGAPPTAPPVPNSGVNATPFTPGSGNSEGISGTFTPGTQIQKPEQPLTPAQQEILTEAGYQAAIAKKDPTANIFPPSFLDPKRNVAPTPTDPNGTLAPGQQFPPGYRKPGSF